MKERELEIAHNTKPILTLKNAPFKLRGRWTQGSHLGAFFMESALLRLSSGWWLHLVKDFKGSPGAVIKNLPITGAVQPPAIRYNKKAVQELNSFS
ncbi:MAG: hypothetical protein J7599_21230 [Niabella sp.]|nr:hypothetical protein [Niabella sp.]